MAKQQYAPKKEGKIVPIRMDATFYNNRALKYLDKLNFQKALRYFRKAIELEPNNPDYYCSMAGVLAELEKYDESNRILWHVLEEIDCKINECYFYLASNYANLLEFELAEQYVAKYLELAPDSLYTEEAEDLLDYIDFQLQSIPRERETGENQEVTLLHDRARRLLEEGRFSEASKILIKIHTEHPDFIAARNNLALCFYYMGRFEKAMDTILSVLEEEPHNIHALCNLAVFYSHLRDKEKLLDLLTLLKKIVPYHFDQSYKLATTLGILGEDEAAYFLFSKMIAQTGLGDVHLLHYGAVAAYNTGRFDEAESLWKKIERLDPDESIAAYYLTQVEQKRNGQSALPGASYHYQTPISDDILRIEAARELSEKCKKDPLIRASFLWALRFGDQDTKLQVIHAAEYLQDDEIEEALRQFLLNPVEDDHLKEAVILVLQKMGAAEPYRAVMEDREHLVQVNPHVHSLPVWHDKWQQVIDCLEHHMQDQYDLLEQQEARALWFDYLAQAYPNIPVIRKQETWAASLEYAVAQLHNRSVTKEEVASRYGVSAVSLTKNYRLLCEVCRSFTE
ncbi:tetratricopeptide repeat protein [Aneurinibacillus uraniidurans]|uniref:tetratricopeptide repeat protein n=1 Tax=Aneurinibacillus uraniidurans TaxID=2966586 RepID=UPI0023497251|nr:tetratricopeptide repeat protein [Aneurinibacillus sp. B1]WCN38202.1 tetratricopeptide repeat protein [Aneurinibacillus sp. B1]